MPREGHGSRNSYDDGKKIVEYCVMPREGHGSRNPLPESFQFVCKVMPREGHGSRNESGNVGEGEEIPSCPARGMGVEIEESKKCAIR